ncbi:4-diphosphocytidyl-2-C-methyl-D-erythritol kinase [Sporobacter termitidis DSM 10068]|uniref:4-diphosphocytidyl-2-C-methyl-D-erythritol kinase n=1 Tax=Sporobacter termitidis DSM 10068 TaxID=1123282 RepID=A0A1M5X6K7_9FIRM|nr:4-(cytidine 5'-diphospho)-2-C-methyl-D-erythritol kinase [Sporobacter termitidis]SHH95208.1 4-diphosphocytidyl-2-C-methyl-D-erythritol kinase [Sporobacter termitidis DSM 10068]
MIIKEKAFAKINLSIDIVARMENGYHSMRMVMQSVALHDELTVTCTPGEGIGVTTDLKYLPGDERNIAARAASVFFSHTGITGWRTDIDIKKSIPVCAGLGGGSTDGAAVLRALNALFEAKLGRETLEQLAAKIGSDVPFCVAGGTALAEGRGEKLTDLPPLPDCRIVICKPAFAISTPELFSRIVCDKIHLRPDTDGLVEALNKRSLAGVARRMYNVFEDVLPKGTGPIGEIKDALGDHGALGAAMTGTGSAVFGLFQDDKSAGDAFEALKAQYSECYLTEISSRISI